MKLIFRVNDRVRCPKNGDGIVLSTMTKSKVITGLYSAEVKVGFGPWTESYDNYAESSNKLSSLELITEEKSVSLKVGDSVRVLEKSSTNYMRVGTIIESGVIFDWRVSFSPCNTPWESFKSINLELITAEKSMKKSDLKSGMVLEFSNGERAVVLLGTKQGDIYSGDTWGQLHTYSDDLIPTHSYYDPIVRILQPSNNRAFSYGKDVSLEDSTILWEYKEPVEELTLAEICKQLGKKVKVIEG